MLCNLYSSEEFRLIHDILWPHANNELQKDPREGYFSSERAAFSTSFNCRHGYKQENIL